MGYIRGKHNIACCDLIDHLAKQGIYASVSHHKESKRGPTVLTVYCKDPDDMPKVAREYEGYRVDVSTQVEADRKLREALARGDV